jgi:hypothetical protein
MTAKIPSLKTRLIQSRLCFLALQLVSGLVYADSQNIPNPSLTPGDILTTSMEDICTPGYSKSVRNVPSSVKQEAYKAYGIYEHGPGEYEVDHLISLELGGSNSIKNLWPESYLTQPLNAHVKDKLENRLHALVCNGALSLAVAQTEIATNWVSAYQKYVGPLPSADLQSKSELLAREHDESGSRQSPAPPHRSNECPKGMPVKVSKRGIYHQLGDPNYDRTHPIACFVSSDEAISSGFRAAKN